jgi:hypothetical protein
MGDKGLVLRFCALYGRLNNELLPPSLILAQLETECPPTQVEILLATPTEPALPAAPGPGVGTEVVLAEPSRPRRSRLDDD